MCFVIHKDHPKAKVAEKDIKVYKVLENNRGRLISTYQYFKYNPKQLYHSKIVIEPWREKLLIDEGLHSFSSLKGVDDHISCCAWEACVCEFIIPKGSEYYYNPDKQEYVSDQTYWTGRVYRTDRWIEFKGKITKKMIYN